MNNLPTLVEIDSYVQVDLSRLDFKRFSKATFISLQQDPFGKVVDYKMTDGRGIGLVLVFNDGSVNWFFDYEIVKSLDNNMNYIDESQDDNINPIANLPFISNISTPKRNVNDYFYMLNPLNFISWVIYSMKDIF